MYILITRKVVKLSEVMSLRVIDYYIFKFKLSTNRKSLRQTLTAIRITK